MATSDRTIEDLIADVGESLAEMAKTLFAAGSLESTLQATVDLAVDSIDGCDYAGIFVIEGGVISTPVHSDPFVMEIDALQHHAGEGPCLDIIAGAGTSIRVNWWRTLAGLTSGRWPAQWESGARWRSLCQRTA